MPGKRLRIPKLLFNGQYGWHVRFTENGHSRRVQYDLPREDSVSVRERAKGLWRLWVIRQYPAALRLPQFVDLAELVKTTPELLRPTAETDPRIRDATLVSLSNRFLTAEKARVRGNGASLERVGTIAPKEYDCVRGAVLLIGRWAAQHYGERLTAVAWADLITLSDYKLMMNHFATAAHNRKRVGYSAAMIRRIHQEFWRLAAFSEDHYQRPPKFTVAQAVRAVPFVRNKGRRQKALPDLETLKRLLAFATDTQRAWIWIALGCGFEPIALAQATPACFDEEIYDLTRSKTGLMRRGKMRPLVWAALQKYLRENPRQAHDLLFRTEEGNPLIRRELKPESMREEVIQRETNSLSQAWEKLRKRSGVTCEGFGIIRHIACTVMLGREGVSLHEVREFLGHAPNTDTWQVYGRYRTPTTKPMLKWVQDMLDCSDPDGWRDEEVRRYEQERDELKERRRAEKWVDCPYCGAEIGNLGRHIQARHPGKDVPRRPKSAARISTRAEEAEG